MQGVFYCQFCLELWILYRYDLLVCFKRYMYILQHFNPLYIKEMSRWKDCDADRPRLFKPSPPIIKHSFSSLYYFVQVLFGQFVTCILWRHFKFDSSFDLYIMDEALILWATSCHCTLNLNNIKFPELGRSGTDWANLFYLKKLVFPSFKWMFTLKLLLQLL